MFLKRCFFAVLILSAPAHAQATGPFAPAPQPVTPSGLRFRLAPVEPAAGFLPPGGFYYVPSSGPLYSATLVNPLRAWQGVGQGTRVTYRVPIAGLNSPAVGVAPRRVRVPIPAGRTGPPATTYLVPITEIDPQQVRLAGIVGEVMEDRPLIEGEIDRVGATGVMVRYRAEETSAVERFAHGHIYFFEGERLVTGISHPDALRPGLEVLVPQPAVKRQSVAGTRQERRPRSAPAGTRRPAR